MNGLKVETPIIPDLEAREQSSIDHPNFAIIGLPNKYGDKDELQTQAMHFLKSIGTQGRYDVYWEPVQFSDVIHNASIAMDNKTELVPLMQYYTDLAHQWGFTDKATLSVAIQIDRKENVNENVHRDGIASLRDDVRAGRHVRGIRFVYPIGRPGTILYPELSDKGSPANIAEGIIENPTDFERVTSPRFLDSNGVARLQSLNQAGALQVMPGNTLVFDMMNSPWHQAPNFTENGAVLTVDISESW
jgi:hypothetical protein